MTEAMLAIVSATADQQRDLVREAWKPDGTSHFIDTLNELVLLSQDECIFEDLEVVLRALDGRMMLVTMRTVTRAMKTKIRMDTRTKYYLATNWSWPMPTACHFSIEHLKWNPPYRKV